MTGLAIESFFEMRGGSVRQEIREIELATIVTITRLMRLCAETDADRAFVCHAFINAFPIVVRGTCRRSRGAYKDDAQNHSER